MDGIKVYIGCCKTDFYLLRSCIASIRYWNKEVPVFLLKDYSRGDFDTAELQSAFTVSHVETKYKKLGGYMKLQPYIEAVEEKVFLQDADMVWLGNIIELLEDKDEDITVHAYAPLNREAELNQWYFKTDNLKQHYPNYKYPGFVFNCGSIFLNKKKFAESDFKDIITWQENARPVYDNVFLCEDQGIVNFIVAKKYLSNAISIAKTNLQIPAESEEAKKYKLESIKNFDKQNVIVHWLGKKNGLTGFCPAKHLLRFYEKQYYNNCKNGTVRMWLERLRRTIVHFDQFLYETVKKIYYFFIPGKNDAAS